MKIKFVIKFKNWEIVMLPNAMNQLLKVDRRTWLHVPSVTSVWSTSNDTHQVVEIQAETFKINNIDHTHVSMMN